MKYVIRYVKPHIPTMIFGFTIKFTGTILDLMIPYILSYIIDEVTPRNDIGLVIRWGLMMAVCAALVLVCNVWANRVASAVSRDSIEALRHDLFYKISYLSSSQVDAFTIPSLVTRMTTDTYNLHRTLNMIQRMGVRAPILMLGGVVVTMFIDPWLSAILCFLIPFMILAVARISRKSIPLFGKAQIAADAMIRVVRENATGIRVIKALSRTEYEKDRYETVNSRLNAAEAKASITMAASGPLINLMLNTGLAAVIVVGAWRVSAGAMKPGAIVAFLTYFTIILNSVMAISRLITMSSKAIASAGRVEEVMMTPQDMEIRPWTGRPETAPGASPDAPDMASGKRPPHMEFDHVSFSYNKRAYNLSDLSFSLEHGQSLGIIGPTGAGKSTLAQLLLRLYDIDSGQIRIDGRDISTFPLKELRQKFGVVFQNDVLFKDSLLNNIDMGRRLDMDAIDQAVDVAQAASVILDESTRLTEVVDGILTLTRMDQLRYQVVPVELAVNGFIEERLECLEGFAYSKNIKLVFQPGEEHKIITDAMLLERAFSNVMSNCIRYAGTQVAVAVREKEGDILITVTDDGPGFPGGGTEHLFDRFYKGKGGNHGLGLAIARCSLEYMGGSVRAADTQKGAEFEITLPQDCRSFAPDERTEM